MPRIVLKGAPRSVVALYFNPIFLPTYPYPPVTLEGAVFESALSGRRRRRAREKGNEILCKTAVGNTEQTTGSMTKPGENVLIGCGPVSNIVKLVDSTEPTGYSDTAIHLPLPEGVCYRGRAEGVARETTNDESSK